MAGLEEHSSKVCRLVADRGGGVGKDSIWAGTIRRVFVASLALVLAVAVGNRR